MSQIIFASRKTKYIITFLFLSRSGWTKYPTNDNEANLAEGLN